jgi:hypothetical protein
MGLDLRVITCTKCLNLIRGMNLKKCMLKPVGDIFVVQFIAVVQVLVWYFAVWEDCV